MKNSSVQGENSQKKKKIGFSGLHWQNSGELFLLGELRKPLLYLACAAAIFVHDYFVTQGNLPWGTRVLTVLSAWAWQARYFA